MGCVFFLEDAYFEQCFSSHELSHLKGAASFHVQQDKTREMIASLIPTTSSHYLPRVRH